MNRRLFINLGVLSSLSLAATPIARIRTIGVNEELADKLKDAVDGKVFVDSIALKPYSLDFSQVAELMPSIVVIPKNYDGVIETLKLAKTYNVKVKIRGTGHSFYGQCLTEGIVIDTQEIFNEITLKKNTVEVSGCVNWIVLEEHLNEHGLTFPVLTNFLGMTIAGTLAHSGVSRSSIKHGHQIDHIVSAEIIMPDGQVLKCSHKKNSEVFQNNFGSLGALGIIKSVKFAKMHEHTSTSYYAIECGPIEEFIDRVSIIANEYSHVPDYFIGRGFNRIILGLEDRNSHLKQEFEKINDRLNGTESKRSLNYKKSVHVQYKIADEEYPIWKTLRKYWSHYLLNEEGLGKFVHYCRDNKFDLLLGGKYQPDYTLFLISNKERSIFPFCPAYDFEEEMLYSVGVFYNINRDDEANNLHAENTLELFRDLSLKLGGKPYLYGRHHLTAKNKKDVYGEKLQNLIELKNKYDPAGNYDSHLI